MSGEKLLLQNQRVKRLYFKTLMPARFCSTVFQQFKLLQNDRVLMIGMICHFMTYIARLCYASRKTFDALFTLLTTICHRTHIDQSGVPLLG